MGDVSRGKNIAFLFPLVENIVINGINDLCSALHHIFATILRPYLLHIGYNSYANTSDGFPPNIGGIVFENVRKRYWPAD